MLTPQNLKPDENTRQIGGGIIQKSGGMILPFRVNPVNNKLLIEIIPKTIGAGISPRNIPIDENTRQGGAGVSDDTNKFIIPLTYEEVVDFPCLRVELI